VLRSMTGFASGRGAHEGRGWSWELRSVNGRGLELRLRLPDWIEGLEAGLRELLGKTLVRGNVTLSLRMQAGEENGRLTLNEAQLERVLSAMAAVEARAMERGLSLAPARPGDILAQRGVLEPESEAGTTPAGTAVLRDALLADAESLIADHDRMRAAEGAVLETVLNGHLDEIARLTDAARDAAEARRPEAEAGFRAALERVMSNAEGADAARVAQELALLAVKADVTEEIDRLRAHVTAARDLLAQGSPIGRKLDFLAQEFNREANTLCSKAQSAPLTGIGLELKAMIEQMREQVQNVE